MNLELSSHRSASIATVVAILCVLGLLWLMLIPADADDSMAREITIENGEGLSQIADTLKATGLIRSKYAFVIYVLLRNQEENLQAGRYRFTRAMSVVQITSRITQGLAESDDVRLVIPEGSNIWDIDEKIHDAGLAELGAFAQAYYTREGKLFPDTYRLKQGASIAEIYQKMSETYLRKAGNPDRYELITASILEKEAKKSEDMAMVADIIYRRLNKGMLLQIDATVGYGWCLRTAIPQNFSKNCDVAQAPIATEIKKDGEFNTYIRHGLPPRPISNPGQSAIQAARNPVANDYWFYLSTRDGTQLIFAKTAAEHSANRRKYLGL